MIISDIKSILTRDLDRLAEEIRLYPESGLLWKILPGTSNSAGNLALHLIGNLRHFVGSVIGKTGYVRNREVEFSTKDQDINHLLQLIEVCKKEVDDALTGYSEDNLDLEFPLEMSGKKSSTGYVLLHLISHFNYHLGQVNYHRRAVSSVKTEL